MTVDIEKLEALEKAATEDCVKWYALKQLKSRAIDNSAAELMIAANPSAVLELIAELKATRSAGEVFSKGCELLEAQRDQIKAENETLKSTLATERLSGFAASFYQVADAVGVTGARSATPEQVFNGEVMPAIEALRKDADRYRFLRDANDDLIAACSIGEDSITFLGSVDLDQHIDAAMGKESACTHSAN